MTRNDCCIILDFNYYLLYFCLFKVVPVVEGNAMRMISRLKTYMHLHQVQRNNPPWSIYGWLVYKHALYETNISFFLLPFANRTNYYWIWWPAIFFSYSQWTNNMLLIVINNPFQIFGITVERRIRHARPWHDNEALWTLWLPV